MEKLFWWIFARYAVFCFPLSLLLVSSLFLCGTERSLILIFDCLLLLSLAVLKTTDANIHCAIVFMCVCVCLRCLKLAKWLEGYIHHHRSTHARVVTPDTPSSSARNKKEKKDVDEERVRHESNNMNVCSRFSCIWRWSAIVIAMTIPLARL